MATTLAIPHVFSGFTLSCDRRNPFLAHPPFSSSAPSKSSTLGSLSLSSNLSYGLFSTGYLSAEMFRRPISHPIVCMAKRYAPSTTKRKRLSRKRGGDPDKKKHRRRKGSKKKKLFKIIRLVSAAGTGFFYAKKKSRKIDKIELKKYDPNVKRHVVFTEVK